MATGARRVASRERDATKTTRTGPSDLKPAPGSSLARAAALIESGGDPDELVGALRASCDGHEPVVPTAYLQPASRSAHLDRSPAGLLLDVCARACADARAIGERLAVFTAHRIRATCAFHRLGYRTEADYAREELGMTVRSFRDLARLGRRLTGLARTRAAFLRGDISRTKAQVIAGIATEEDEASWLARAEDATVRELKKAAKKEREKREARREARKGGAVKAGPRTSALERAEQARQRVTFKVPPSMLGKIDAVLELVTRVGGARLPAGVLWEFIGAEYLSDTSSTEAPDGPEAPVSVGSEQVEPRVPQSEQEDPGMPPSEQGDPSVPPSEQGDPSVPPSEPGDPSVPPSEPGDPGVPRDDPGDPEFQEAVGRGTEGARTRTFAIRAVTAGGQRAHDSGDPIRPRRYPEEGTGGWRVLPRARMGLSPEGSWKELVSAAEELADSTGVPDSAGMRHRVSVSHSPGRSSPDHASPDHASPDHASPDHASPDPTSLDAAPAVPDPPAAAYPDGPDSPWALHHRMVRALEQSRTVDWQLGRLLAAIHDRRLWSDMLFRSFAHYVQERIEISSRHAQRLVRADRLALDSPSFAVAWKAGRLSVRQAELLGRVLPSVRTEACRHAWIETARRSTFDRLSALVRCAERLIAERDPDWTDTDGAPAAAEARLEEFEATAARLRRGEDLDVGAVPEASPASAPEGTPAAAPRATSATAPGAGSATAPEAGSGCVISEKEKPAATTFVTHEGPGDPAATTFVTSYAVWMTAGERETLERALAAARIRLDQQRSPPKPPKQHAQDGLHPPGPVSTRSSTLSSPNTVAPAAPLCVPGIRSSSATPGSARCRDAGPSPASTSITSSSAPAEAATSPRTS